MTWNNFKNMLMGCLIILTLSVGGFTIGNFISNDKTNKNSLKELDQDIKKLNENIDKKRKEHEEKINKLDEEKQKAFEDCESKNGIIVMTFGVRAVCINKSAVIFEREIY